MSDPIRIGLNIGSTEPYWIMLRESIIQYANTLPVKLIPLEINNTDHWTQRKAEQVIEQITAQRVSALISWSLPAVLLNQILDARIKVIIPAETKFQHPNLVSLSSLYDAAYLVTRYIATRLNQHGDILIVDGSSFTDLGIDRRMEGIRHAARAFPRIRLLQVPAPYPPEDPGPYIETGLMEIAGKVDAIIGTSDHLTLATREIALKLGILQPGALIAGIGGDPLALVAIDTGKMAATVDITPLRLCKKFLDVAYQAALGLPFQQEIKSDHTLITSDNVQEIIHEKFLVFSRMPTRMVGINREQQERHINQLETSLQTIRRMSSILDRKRVLTEIFDILHKEYEYHKSYIYLWAKADQALILEDPWLDQQEPHKVTLMEGGLLGRVFVEGEMLFILDIHNTPQYPSDPRFPRTRSRAILPIRVGEEIVGVLDLHSYHLIESDQERFLTLQILADQIGTAMRNAKLYENALVAQTRAEEADNLKTRLLANVSHELRTPLNLIMSYSQLALTSPEFSQTQSPVSLRNDLSVIYSNASHLLRLINDLLDLSRAEINELKLYPITLTPQGILEEVFNTIRNSIEPESQVEWRLEIPEKLPLIRADPVRFRQILYNLLSNAYKFTEKGHITLGAEVDAPNLHLWVEDTGQGITLDLKDHIFEPFVTSQMPTRRREEGIGLGLTIARRIVAMHNGSMSLDSTPGQGSTFHIRIPLPNLSDRPAPPVEHCQSVLLVITCQTDLPKAIAEIASRQNMEVRRIRPGDNLETILNEDCPAAVAWDVTQASPGDWGSIENIRRHPLINKIPFILFGPNTDDPDGDGAMPGVATTRQVLTSVVTKPVSTSTLQDLIETMRPANASGSVLIIDDDPQTCDAYRKILAQSLPQSSVSVAYSGEQALIQLKRITPALILLDLVMPGMSGFEVLDALRTNPKIRSIPVIVLSGKVLSAEDIQKLNNHNVVVQIKGILSNSELAGFLSQTLSAADTPPTTNAVIKKALIFLQDNYALPLTRLQIAQAIGVSETYLSNIFHQELGIALWEYLNRIRISAACKLLKGTTLPVNQIAVTVGFADPAYFSRLFHKQTGVTPSLYRAAAAEGS